MNITDALVPYFGGKVSWEKAASEACELFLKTFESATFICESCGEIIFPKVTTNEHGIFIESNRTELRALQYDDPEDSDRISTPTTKLFCEWESDRGFGSKI